MTALVDPPSAMSTVMAFSNASRVIIRAGVRPASIMGTAARPLNSAMARRRESGAGMLAQPVSDIPKASARLVMVEAVPITVQWPEVGYVANGLRQHSGARFAPS